MPSIATGVTQTGVYIGGVIGPVMFGTVAESLGFAAAWLIVAVLMVISSLGIRYGAHLAARPEVRVEPVG